MEACVSAFFLGQAIPYLGINAESSLFKVLAVYFVVGEEKEVQSVEVRERSSLPR